MTPEQRSLRASIAAHTLHATGGTNTVAARRAFDRKFKNEVDPDGTLHPAERAKRAAHARSAHFKRLSLAAARSRQAKTAGRTP